MKKVPKSFLNMAQKSKHKKFKHVAVVMRGGSVLAIAANSCGHHAEVAALEKVKDPTGTKVISIRVSKSGELRMAKPCGLCEKVMRLSGVKSVTYSTSDGSLKVERYGRAISI